MYLYQARSIFIKPLNLIFIILIPEVETRGSNNKANENHCACIAQSTQVKQYRTEHNFFTKCQVLQLCLAGGGGGKHGLHSLANNQEAVELDTYLQLFKPSKLHFITHTHPQVYSVSYCMNRSNYIFSSYTSHFIPYHKWTFPQFICQDHNFLFTAISLQFPSQSTSGSLESVSIEITGERKTLSQIF